MRPTLPALVALSLSTLLAPAADGGPLVRQGVSKPAGITARIGTLTPTADATALATMLAGPGVTVANARFVGHASAAGTFAGAAADVGIASGVVLSTGQIVDLDGPNLFDSVSTDLQMPGDPALDALVAPHETYDAAILEFDVVPSASTLSITYTFGSEEYNEFVGSPFNDVVAIFVNGVNCANVNGFPVSVNTVNAGSNASLYVDNTGATRDTELDGLTTPLECVAAVTPGVPNRVRIAIADTSDEIYDAAVFLAAGGIRSPGSGPLTSSVLTKVIEYYHAAFDHFFVTASADEITKLDAGVFVGWARTGGAFNALLSGAAGSVPVCRFFSTSFAPKSSHFYTPFATECNTVKANPNWQFEDTVFNMILADSMGGCPAGTQPLYRLYNNGKSGAPNHRYTTDIEVLSTMMALGWVPEGSGIGVVACVPF